MNGEARRPPVGLVRRQDRLESALKALVAERRLPLYRMMGYHMGWYETTGEERIADPPLRPRGLLTLLSAETLGADHESALPQACAVEYLHNHLLVHDDIRDGNSERAGRPSVWWSWGPAQAINTGDGMHALARLALFEMRSTGVSAESTARALRLLDEANLETCEGQYRDITLQERLDVGVDEYLELCESQTGAMIACGLRLGAIGAGLDSVDAHSALATFGRKLGAAMRVADDYAVLWPGGDRDEVRQGRLVAKKKTLPVAHAMETGSPTDRRMVGEIYMERVIDPATADKLIELLDGTGGREHALATIANLLGEGRSALEAAELPADAVRELSAAAEYLAAPGTEGAALEPGRREIP